ncbi:hypothetical protein I203_102948 [Kwoniella mangroviensis CBS 8507]|uniref:uncharacterized protein n=1 Tax=Kwoniella mangroviensis CBS 8507 TaxID=1296122 RepID=UPI003028EA01
MSKGDLIIIEKPYLVLPLTEDGEEPDNKVYHKLYLNLSLEHKRIFDGLYERKDDLADKDHIVNKIDTNAIPLAQTSQDGSVVMKKMGLFEVISRVNHGCKPNAGWYWYGEEREMRLYAYTDIPAHAEITCSYLSYEHLEYCKIDDDVIKTLRKLNRSLKLLEREEKFNQLGEVYEKIFEVYAVHGSSDTSRLAANEALNHFKAIMGEKEATKTWVARQSVDPTLYPLWNKLGMIHSDSVTEHQDESEENEDDDEDKEKDMGEGGIGKVHRSRSRKWEEKSWDGSD